MKRVLFQFAFDGNLFYVMQKNGIAGTDGHICVACPSRNLGDFELNIPPPYDRTSLDRGESEDRINFRRVRFQWLEQQANKGVIGINVNEVDKRFVGDGTDGEWRGSDLSYSKSLEIEKLPDRVYRISVGSIIAPTNYSEKHK